MTIFITGGLGFIGSNFIRKVINKSDEKIVNLDLQTYAGNSDNLKDLEGDCRYCFIRGDISHENTVNQILEEHKPWAIVNFAAESHVDRSIAGPGDFIQTNINGVFNLLNCAKKYLETPYTDVTRFRFLQVSTDEVFGSLSVDDAPFNESNQYLPNSPYAASKASSDHLVRAWFRTYGLPTLITNCSNNYGPFQFPEKLIPLTIQNALIGKNLPIYGDGKQIRDWLHVYDHCDAIFETLTHGRVGETYNVGGDEEKQNIEVVKSICFILDKLKPRDVGNYSDLITYVTDRAGHDRRYAINNKKIKTELGWKPKYDFETGLQQTVEWYLKSKEWLERIRTGRYQA